MSAIVNATMDAIITLDDQKLITAFNPAAETLFQIPRDEALGRHINMLVPARFRLSHEAHLNAFLESATIHRRMGSLGEISGARADGTEFPVEASISRVDLDGRRLMTVILRDISERRSYEAARQLLVRELNHRIKNTFTVISSFASILARRSATPQDLVEALRDRIAALAIAHDLILPAISDETLQSEVSLSTILAAVIEPLLINSRDYLTLSGPATVLNPLGATHLALVLHELATNAAKYGCLSSVNGRLDVVWTKDADSLEIVWTERGGPAIDAAPARRGFGSTLIDLTLQNTLKGELESNWLRCGVSHRLRLPLAIVRA